MFLVVSFHYSVRGGAHVPITHEELDITVKPHSQHQSLLKTWAMRTPPPDPGPAYPPDMSKGTPLKNNGKFNFESKM